MKLIRPTDQRGFAHMVEIVIIGVIVLGVAGFIVWRMLSSGQPADTSGTNNNTNQNQTSVPCNSNDADLCKFFNSWKESTEFKVVSRTTSDGQTSESTFISTEGGKNYHIVMSIAGTPWEMIGIGDTTYTKATDGTWWKQTTKKEENTYKESFNYDFEAPGSDSSSEPEADKTTYKKLGTEACGNLTCFKYEIVDPSSDSKQYLWFDNKDYQLRRMRIESANGDVSDQTFDYGNVSVTAPSPVKELGPNQYLIPGQSEPMTIPTP